MSRQDYSRVPAEEAIEMGDPSKAYSEKPAPKVEEPASRGMVIFSVSFYLVAAIVVSSPFVVVERNGEMTRGTMHGDGS